MISIEHNIISPNGHKATRLTLGNHQLFFYSQSIATDMARHAGNSKMNWGIVIEIADERILQFN